MIIKKSVLFFISLFPISVLASPASVSSVNPSFTKVSVTSSSFKSKLKEGSDFSEIDSSEISLNIPKGLSVDAYPLIDFGGESVTYTPGQYDDLINIQSIIIKKEYIERLPPLTLKVNEGDEVDLTTCLTVQYLKLGSGSKPEILGSVCIGQNMELFNQMPSDPHPGNNYALYFYDDSSLNNMTAITYIEYKENGMKMKEWFDIANTDGYQGQIGEINIQYTP